MPPLRTYPTLNNLITFNTSMPSQANISIMIANMDPPKTGPAKTGRSRMPTHVPRWIRRPSFQRNGAGSYLIKCPGDRTGVNRGST
ncbi:unnamed protein product [Cutaneotrichosporon oleaginosum]